MVWDASCHRQLPTELGGELGALLRANICLGSTFRGQSLATDAYWQLGFSLMGGHSVFTSRQADEIGTAVAPVPHQAV